MSDGSNSGAGVVVIYAHPYPDRSRANRVLFDAVRALPGVDARAIYDLYPDFDIDIEAEQAALMAAHTVVWQHPVYWYTAPALMKLWFEKVLAHDWAYGAKGRALVGKRCLWVVTTGGDASSYGEGGMHHRAGRRTDRAFLRDAVARTHRRARSPTN